MKEINISEQDIRTKFPERKIIMVDYDNISCENFYKMVVYRAGCTAMIIQELYNTDWYTAFHKLYTSSTYHQLTNIITEFWKISPYWLHANIMKESGIIPLPGKDYYRNNKDFRTNMKFSAFIENQRLTNHQIPAILLNKLHRERVLDCIFYNLDSLNLQKNKHYIEYLKTVFIEPVFVDA